MIKYEIKASVTPEGIPSWDLYRLVMNELHYGAYKIASNTDRGVLEKAVKHLESASRTA